MARALGRYELLRPLARGGMAEVYLARRRAAGIEKWLVVKRMRPERSGDPRFLDLFVREARLSMSLAHQNIVPVFDFGRIDDQVFLAMERVEGKDLGSSLARAPDHRLPPLLAAFVAAECCQALDYAHQRKGADGVALGIVHRDVTPRNVLLSWSGEVKLTDFGIAALAGDATSRLLGTPQYMAPEQARSEAIDPRADIYAIGLVLREAITGVRPRPGGDREAILDAARRGDLVPWPHLLAPAAPPVAPDAELASGSDDHGEPPPRELVAIIDRATATTAAERYPDARSMLEELDAFMVAERAARKAESPARQLAAWLGAVWAGARDDAESDAAIQAEHLVSFLDDGAIDVLGTGTVRSMAATAADDHVEPHVPPVAPTPPSGRPTVVVAPQAISANPALPAAAAGPRTDVARISRISSSTSTVASGSFHTLPSRDGRRSGSARSLRAPSLRSLASLVVVAVAAGALVFWVMNNRRERELAGEPPRLAAPPVAEPHAPPPPPAPALASVPAVVPAATDHAAPDAATGDAATDHSKPHDGRTGDHAAVPPHGSWRPGASHAADVTHTDPAHGGTTASRGSGSSGDPAGGRAGSAGSAGPAAARPATCRVRINLTPWAYYTADDDTARHETPGTIDLTPGRHRLHVWNPELRVERDIFIDVPADRDSMNYSEPLQPATLAPDAGVR